METDTTTIAQFYNLFGQERHPAIPVFQVAAPAEICASRWSGKVTPFTANKIFLVITKALLAIEGYPAAASSQIRDTVTGLTDLDTLALT